MRSMSGFGRATASGGGVSVVCEARSVNHRFGDVSVSLPPAFAGLEPAARREVSASSSRGRVEVTVSVDARGRAAAKGIRLDEDLLAWYAARLKKAAARAGLGVPDAGILAQLPGVVVRDPLGAAAAGAAAGVLVMKAVRGALAALSAMRAREGAALVRVLRRSTAALARGVEGVASAWPEAVKRQRQRTDERLVEALARLGEAGKTGSARELLASIERGDVTEELDRLRSHMAQVRDTLGRAGALGKRLDFLSQEVQRELNTIGAKCGDAEVVRLVVGLKEEAERFREQVQNVE